LIKKIKPERKTLGQKSELPSSKLIIILENRDYMAMMKEKLAEIKGVYRNLRLAPVGI